MKLSKMNETELKNLFEESEWLRDEVRNYFMDDCCYDYLYTVPRFCSYQIGSYCQGEHFKINGKRYSDLTESEIVDVFEWLTNLQKDYYFLTESEFDLVKEWKEKALKYIEDDSEDKKIEYEYNFIESRLNSIIYKRLQSEYDQYLNDDCLFECFTDCIDSFDYIEIETDGNNYYRVEKSKIA